jgi:glutathione S-transferase
MDMTLAILMLLAERHPEAGFAPPPGSPERGAWLQWMTWLANGPMATFRLWFYEADLPGIDRAALQAKLEGYWDQVDARLAGREVMVGDSLSTVDLQLAMLTRWSRNMPRPATAWPHLKRFVDAMRARAALRRRSPRDPAAPQFTDHYFTGDYPTRLLDREIAEGQADGGKQLSFLVSA